MFDLFQGRRCELVPLRKFYPILTRQWVTRAIVTCHIHHFKFKLKDSKEEPT